MSKTALANDLFRAFQDMRSDGDFARLVAAAISKFFNTKRVLNTASPPVPVPVTSTPMPGQPVILQGAMTKTNQGIAKGIMDGAHLIATLGTAGRVFAGVKLPIQTGLMQVFNTMDGMDKNGDRYFADQAATIIDRYAAAGGMT